MARTNPTALLAGALALLALAAPAAAQLECGGTVGPGGTFVLDRDLDCRQDPGCQFPNRCTPALTVLGDAVLDLNGHTITCSSGDDDGVRLAGERAVLRNGQTNICGTGVRVAGGGRHVVRNVVANRSKNDGFSIADNDGNVLERNVADTSGGNGFRLSRTRNNVLVANTAVRTERFNGFNLGSGATGNRLRDNQAFGNAADGFNVTDDGNKMVRNVAVANGTHGINLTGDRNVVRGNRTSSNAVGIDSSGAANVIASNVALANDQVDLDGGEDCDDSWQGNVFGTGEPADCVR